MDEDAAAGEVEATSEDEEEVEDSVVSMEQQEGCQDLVFSKKNWTLPSRCLLMVRLYWKSERPDFMVDFQFRTVMEDLHLEDGVGAVLAEDPALTQGLLRLVAAGDEEMTSNLVDGVEVNLIIVLEAEEVTLESERLREAVVEDHSVVLIRYRASFIKNAHCCDLSYLFRRSLRKFYLKKMMMNC